MNGLLQRQKNVPLPNLTGDLLARSIASVQYNATLGQGIAVPVSRKKGNAVKTLKGTPVELGLSSACCGSVTRELTYAVITANQ